MKTRAFLLSSMLALGGLALALSFSGCGTDVRVSGRAAIHYGPFSFWFYDRPWLDGPIWWREGIVIHPPPIHLGGPHSWPPIPYRPRPRIRR